MESVFFGFNLVEISLGGLLSLTFIIQLIFYLGRYGKIPTFRQKVSNKVTPPVSVVVVIEDDLGYVEQVLPKLLMQEYDLFEVVVVDYGSAPETVEALNTCALRYPHLKTTRINPDSKFKRRRKLALTVGIKAARYPHLLFTETNCHPTSAKWLAMMARGFTTGEVVIGYTGIEPGKGLVNRLIRCSRLMSSVRYLSAAIRGKAYKAMNNNFGFTYQLYFDKKGYNYLQFNTGDDDLFLQEIANRKNTSVILNPKATLREIHYGGWSRWFNERRFCTYTYRYYPFGVKAGIATELLSRALFFASAIASLALMIPYLWIGAIGAIVVRYLALFFTLSRICIRLGERGLLPALLIHDFVSPISETLLSLSRRLRPSQGIWS